MSDPAMFFVGVFTATVLWVLVLLAVDTRGDTRRDLFLSYCTAHGDKYEVCAKAWEEGEMK